jgi:hypothetical protein
MFKAKTLAIFASMIATLAVSATPAFAEFQSTNSKTTGSGKSGAVTLEGGGATLECTSSEGPWTIFSGETAATKGSTLSLITNKWNGCKVNTKEVKGIVATVTEGGLVLNQSTGETKAKGSIKIEFWIKIKILGNEGELHVVIGKGTTNKELLTNTLSNSGSNLIITGEDSGITTTVTGKFPGATGTKEAKLKEIVTDEDLNEV